MTDQVQVAQLAEENRRLRAQLADAGIAVDRHRCPKCGTWGDDPAWEAIQRVAWLEGRVVGHLRRIGRLEKSVAAHDYAIERARADSSRASDSLVDVENRLTALEHRLRSSGTKERDS